MLIMVGDENLKKLSKISNENSGKRYSFFQVNKDEYGSEVDSFIRNHKDATPYHTSSWAQVVRRTFAFKNMSLVCRDENNNVQGFMPFWKTGRGYSNSPWRDRGQLLATNPEVEKVFFSTISDLENVSLKNFETVQEPKGFKVVDYWQTHRLNLLAGEEDVWRIVNKKVGRNIRRAEKHEFRICNDDSVSSMEDFYKLFQLTRKRLGVPIYPYTLFSNIFKFMCGNGLKVFVAYTPKGDPVSALILFLHRKLSIYAYGASDIRYSNTRVNDLLIWHAIKYSIDAGCTVFDFGADSPNQQSLIRYKRKWGALSVPLPTLVTSSNSSRFSDSDFSSGKYRMHRKILSHLPVSLLTLLGRTLMVRGD